MPSVTLRSSVRGRVRLSVGATAFATPSVPIDLAGDAVAQTTAAAALQVGVHLVGSAQTAAQAAANLILGINLSGSAQAAAQAAAALLKAANLSGAAVASAQGSATLDDEGIAADWAARSQAEGVFFAENFDYADLTAFANHANNPCYYGHSAGGGTVPPSNLYALITDPAIALSGKAMRIIRPAQAGASTTSMQYSWDTNNGPGVPFTPAALRQNYYFQFIVHGDLVFNWPWTQGVGTQWATPKLMQLGRHDDSTIKGEIVFVNPNVRRCVTAYMRDENGSNTWNFSRGLSTVFNGSDRSWQPSINNTAISSPSTPTQYRNKYGVLEYDQDYPPGFTPGDYAPITAASRLEEHAPWLDAFNESHAANAGVPWVKNGRTVVTIHRQASPSPRIRAWAGPYGSPQRLIFDTDAGHWTQGAALSFITTLTDPAVHVGAGFQMSLYVTDDAGEAGANRPDMWVDYIELIASTNPIPAPGGFPLPGAVALAGAAVASASGSAALSNVGGSDLADLASGMVSGDWGNFTMGGMNLSLVDAGSGQSIIEYTARGFWDPARKLIRYWGQGHSAGQKLITWDDATNQWGTPDTTVVYSGLGHAYYHLALDPDTGDLYLKRYSSTPSISRMPFGGSWSGIATPTNYDSVFTTAIEWFPEFNGGEGALVHHSLTSVQTWDGTSWTTRSSSLTGLGNLHPWIARAGGYMWFGGGDGSAKTYRMDASGNVTTNANYNTPINGGVATGTNNPVISHPNGTHLLQFETEVGGAIYLFNGSTWAAHGTHQIGTPEQFFGVPVPDYGVIVFVAQPGSADPPYVKVYKP